MGEGWGGHPRAPATGAPSLRLGGRLSTSLTTRSPDGESASNSLIDYELERYRSNYSLTGSGVSLSFCWNPEKQDRLPDDCFS